MTANPGTVIHGTLKTDDLLSAFAAKLQALVANDQVDDAFKKNRASLISRARTAAEFAPDGDEAMWVLDELSDALDEYSPPGHYFGAHEGDGSDFGFWPNERE